MDGPRWPRGRSARCEAAQKTASREEGKIQNSIKRHPKITKFESQLHNNTKKLFPKYLLQKINPSPPEKRFGVGTLERELFPQNH
jgi:hypothetical protein